MNKRLESDAPYIVWVAGLAAYQILSRFSFCPERTPTMEQKIFTQEEVDNLIRLAKRGEK